MKKIFHLTGICESNLSAAEWARRLITLATVAGGGTTAGLLAQGTELFEGLGPLGWIGIGLIASLLIAAIFMLVNMGRRQAAEASYMQSLSQVRSKVNPLAESLSDQVIYVPDLYLPRRQVHSKKQFKRCKLVGPGAIAMLGGAYLHTGFLEAGSPIVLPENTMLTGVLVLENCTIKNCELIEITILLNKQAGEAFKAMGAPVVGM